jgi:hypothetical protein
MTAGHLVDVSESYFSAGGLERFATAANLWPISARTPHNSRIPSELPAREPANPSACVTLLTGGLLVRVQPEEPASKALQISHLQIQPIRL